MRILIERIVAPAGFTLAGLMLGSGGLIRVNGVDFVPSGCRLEVEGQCVIIDPVGLEASPVPPLAILLTHAHPDHRSLPDIERLAGPETLILGPARALRGIQRGRLQPLRPGEKLELPGFALTALPAYNLKPIFLWLRAHPRRAGGLGYLIQAGVCRIYVAGDTDALPEIAGLPPLDLALLPIGGEGLTMTPQDAARLADLLRPRWVVPVHYEPGKGCLEVFRASLDPRIGILEAKGGEAPTRCVEASGSAPLSPASADEAEGPAS